MNLGLNIIIFIFFIIMMILINNFYLNPYLLFNFLIINISKRKRLSMHLFGLKAFILRSHPIVLPFNHPFAFFLDKLNYNQVKLNIIDKNFVQLSYHLGHSCWLMSRANGQYKTISFFICFRCGIDGREG